MEVEAKIVKEEGDTQWYFLVWDRTKYTIQSKRVRTIALVVFSFFLGYSLVSMMKRAETITNGAISANMFTITPAQEMVSQDSFIQHVAGEKQKVAKGPSYSGPQVIHREIAGIPPGTLIRAKLITGASDGPVRAKILRDVTVNGEIMIESNAILIGQGTSSEERLLIRFDRLIKKDGSTLQVQAQALDSNDRIAGLKGNKVSTEFAKLGAGIGLSFVGGLSEGLQETEVKGGAPVKSSSLRNGFLNGASIAALDQSKELITSYREKAPKIEVERGKLIWVMVE